MENATIARVLGEIADLLEIRGENPFRIRAYRNAAQAVRDTAVRLVELDEPDLRGIPGIGKDIAARIRELSLTGRSSFHDELTTALPIGLLDILQLQGVGPKTVAQLYEVLHITSIDELEQAARAGALSGIKGMGSKKADQLLRAIDERRQFVGRHLASTATAQATWLIDITLLAGIECDIRPDGTMDLADDCLAELDLVVASVHSALTQDATAMTDRVLRAIENPYVDILGHPTGRMLLRRDASLLDVERMVGAAVAAGVALEINGQPRRRDLSDVHARLALERGAWLVVSSDAHTRHGFDHHEWAVLTARRAWATPDRVLNSQPLAVLRSTLRRHRQRSHA